MLVKLTEIITVVAAVILQAAYLHKRKAGFKAIVLLSIVTVPVLVMSIESMNSFLTCDETYIVYEPLNLSTDTLKMWQLGAFRTTDLVVGLPVSALKALSGFSLDILALFGKSLHWIIGFIVVILIIDNMMRILKKEDDFLFAYAVLFFAVMLMPVVMMAQKIINYDSLSMLFGTLALVLLAAGWQKGENYHLYLYLGIISAALGAQEKLISSPVLWACLCLVPLRVSWETGIEKTTLLIRKVSLNSLKAAITAISTILFTYIIVAYVNKSGIPDSNVFNLFYPLISGLWPVLRLVGIDVSGLLVGNSFNNILYIPVFAILLSLTIIIFNVSVMLICRKAGNTQWIQKSGKLLLNRLPLINFILFTILLISGVCGTFLIDARLAPFYPPLSGSFQPSVSFNNSFVHFGAGNAVTHIIFSVFWACAVFVNAIPATIVFLALFNAILLFLKRKESLSPVLEITFTAVLLVPFVFGIILIPVGNRYFNLFLLLFSLITVSKLMEQCISGKKTRIAAVTAICILLVEILPFRPLYAAFRPFWSNYSRLYSTSPSRGILNPSWMGWGEEISIAGKRIEKKLYDTNRSLSGVNIYHNYLGEWMYRQNDAVFLGLDTCTVFRYTENDFYILNRMGITQSSFSFPKNISPYDIISFRGFVTAWVFRGDDLKKHGFTFK